MTQIISNNNGGGGGGASYTAGTGIDISAQNEISIDTDVVQTVGNMVNDLTGADDDHYPTAKAVADAISGGGLGDVIGPASSTDGDIVLFDGASGKLIKDSGALLSSKLDASAMSNNNYGGAWQGDSTHTPTKGVLYDKIHTMDVEIGNKAADNTVVKLSGNQTINGTKTFGTSPVVPSKSTDATNTGTAIATEAQVYNVQQDVDAIDDLIPSAATVSNQLADKDYVNDSINSVTAYYITKNAQGDQWATYAELAAATTFYSGGVVRVPTRNDYTIVLADENHDNATTRYSYQGNSWEYQYTVNETALTQAQLDALNSGITSGKVFTYDGYASQISGKQDQLVSGTNIKTINSNSLLGSGNIAINEVPAGGTEGQVLTKTNDGMDWETPAATGVISSNHTYEDMVHLSQAEYDALVSPDPDTFYSTPDDESGAFEPENTGNTGDKLEKTNTGYQWVEGELVELIADNYSAMQGPCSSGFHVPIRTEWVSLVDAMSSLGLSSDSGYETYLHIPSCGLLSQSDGTFSNDGQARYGSCKNLSANYSEGGLEIYGGTVNVSNSRLKNNGVPIRPFKDIPVVPDSSWTVVYQGTGDAGVYYKSTLGLISISSDGVNWITISDKNLGATTVFNYGNTRTEANCGKFYQWGNNYGFSRSGAATTSSTQVDASSYGPSNYYSSSTFITGNNGWDSSNNANLWGGVTGIKNTKYVSNEKINEVLNIGVAGQVLTKTNTGYEFQNSDYLSSPFYKLLTGNWTELSTDTYTIPTTAGSGTVGNSRNLKDYKVYKIELIYSYSVIREGIFFAYPNMSYKDYKPEIIVPLQFDGSQNPMIYMELGLQVGYSSGRTYFSKQKSTYRLKNSAYGGASFTEKIYGIN